MRGRRFGAAVIAGLIGLTPANAGTTRVRRRERIGDPAHPRECGDDVSKAAISSRAIGSPPRMRGRLGGGGCRVIGQRAHPRECGDDNLLNESIPGISGSPPRMRGRRRWNVPRAGRRWLTPANAGTTRCGTMPRPTNPAHPRECGDDGRWLPRSRETIGSPPRMRGRRYSATTLEWAARLTPANAGTTALFSQFLYVITAHPRECGDDCTNH